MTSPLICEGLILNLLRRSTPKLPECQYAKTDDYRRFNLVSALGGNRSFCGRQIDQDQVACSDLRSKRCYTRLPLRA